MDWNMYVKRMNEICSAIAFSLLKWSCSSPMLKISVVFTGFKQTETRKVNKDKKYY